LAGISLDIDGKTLIDMGYAPSRKFKEVLDRLFDLKLDGYLKDKKEEIDYAKRLLEAQSDRGRA